MHAYIPGYVYDTPAVTALDVGRYMLALCAHLARRIQSQRSPDPLSDSRRQEGVLRRPTAVNDNSTAQSMAKPIPRCLLAFDEDDSPSV